MEGEKRGSGEWKQEAGSRKQEGNDPSGEGLRFYDSKPDVVARVKMR